MSFKYLLFKEMFRMSSAAAQKASTKSFQIFSTIAVVDPTQPNPWVNPTHGQLCVVVKTDTYCRFTRRPVSMLMCVAYMRVQLSKTYDGFC